MAAERDQRRRGRRATVVVEAGATGVEAREAHWSERLRARLRHRRLDHALALGESPESSAEMSLRARFLARPATRRRLAAQVRRTVAQAQPRIRLVRARPIFDLASVRAVGSDLQQLADRLDGPAPLPARGVALLLDLLQDGGSPLYRPGQRIQLRARVRRACAALEPTVDWPVTA